MIYLPESHTHFGSPLKKLRLFRFKEGVYKRPFFSCGEDVQRRAGRQSCTYIFKLYKSAEKDREGAGMLCTSYIMHPEAVFLVYVQRSVSCRDSQVTDDQVEILVPFQNLDSSVPASCEFDISLAFGLQAGADLSDCGLLVLN